MIELMSLSQSGRFAELERKARLHTERFPRAGFAWKALAVALKMQSKDSLPAAQRAAQLLPNDAEAHTNLGVALWDAARVAEAISSFQRAIRIRPNDAAAHYRLGNVLLEMGRIEEAAVSYQRAAQLAPNAPEVRYGLGNALRVLGRLDQSAAQYRRALELQPDHPEVLTQLGIALRLLGRTDEAEASLERALQLDPGRTSAILALADAFADRGRFGDAETQFRRALSTQPDLAEAWVGLARTRRMTAADADWLSGAQRVLAGPIRPREAISLHYAVGKYFDDLGQYDQAFESFRRANELTKLHSRRYEREPMAQTVGRLTELFDRGWLEAHLNRDQTSERPVLVVGMPRSGTSLIEQIIAAHPEGAGVGELMFWNEASRYFHIARAQSQSAAAGQSQGQSAAPAQGATAAMPPPAPESRLPRFASDYLQLLESLALATATRVVDKMPSNFSYLGLIHASLPRARIVHVRRDPVDTCLSIYCQDFGAQLAYANDLEDLVHYYGQYRRLMQHWRSILPADSLLEIDYEDLVSDPASGARRLIAFIGLSWDDRCLEPHAAERSVVTMSKWQVRQRISTSAVGRWRHYAGHIAPLLSLHASEPSEPRAGER